MKHQAKHLALALIMVLGTIIGAVGALRPVVTTAADGDSVTIQVNKRDGAGLNQVVDNSNAADVDKMLQDTKPVAGATFSIYNISDKFYSEIKNKPDKSRDELIAEAIFNSGTYTAGIEPSTGTTGADGVANIPGLPEKTSSNYSVFMVKETGTPKGHYGSVPFIIILPIENEDGVVRVYPKNYQVSKRLLTGTEDGPRDFEVGTELEYQVDFTIPTDITRPQNAYINFTILDKMTGVDYVKDSLAVYLDGAETATPLADLGGVLTEPGNGTIWKIVLAPTDPQRAGIYKDNAGKTVSLKYKVKTTQALVPDNAAMNELTFQNFSGGQNHTTKVDSTAIITGGMKIMKVNEEGEKLKDAGFVLSLGGKYARFEGTLPNITGVTWVDELAPSDDADKPTVIRTDENGLAAVPGLKYGDYTLIEVETPEGHLVPKDDDAKFDYTVAFETYSKDQKTITNYKTMGNGSLPSTGSIGLIAIVLIGLVLLIGAFFLRNKKNDKTA
ncbi:SpaH/EbpB family LPXTG-anchored major pilin [Lacticaseibacillus pabuli]|uniref:SpaH/EbpB family LPXTG-anchored major pilin n=1 Tax=Lacticaseibacillus pabuli TaxID=3025672 RepID=A0ABY7WTG0_9LACO|nr:SpaH/EbpB family LPXTG-anchored major pilin [Lacticaseibacillus sp. KACC 23028]WDF82445.1 SpaH/EbpB family LPXTG-anchored major pilin [Lacticaseibacillus sp. KACC 23028]